MKHRFRALTSTVEVEIRDNFVATRLAELLIAGYEPSSDEPSLAYELANDAVLGIGRYRDVAFDPMDVVPMFELDLYQQVAELAMPGWLLHAAALEFEGGAYVFAGPSGAGKTTLTLSLMELGWRLITEEMVLIDRGLAVHGLARPIHAPASGTQRERIPSTWRCSDYPIRVGENTACSVIAQPPLERRMLSAIPLRSLVRLDHGPDHAPSIEPMPPHHAIPKLWECTLRPDAAGLSAAATIVNHFQTRELRSSRPAQAVAQAIEITTRISK